MKSIVALLIFGLLAVPAIAEDKKPEIRLRDLEQRVHAMVNDARKTNGRGELQLDEKLSVPPRRSVRLMLPVVLPVTYSGMISRLPSPW